MVPAKVSRFKVLNTFRISLLRNHLFKEMERNKNFYVGDHLGTIAASDLSLCTGAAQISIFIHSPSQTENIYDTIA